MIDRCPCCDVCRRCRFADCVDLPDGLGVDGSGRGSAANSGCDGSTTMRVGGSLTDPVRSYRLQREVKGQQVHDLHLTYRNCFWHWVMLAMRQAKSERTIEKMSPKSNVCINHPVIKAPSSSSSSSSWSLVALLVSVIVG